MAFIYNLTDSWNDVTTTWNGIKLAVTNTSSDASSKLLNLTVSGATTASFVVDKSGNLELNGSVNKVTITAPATAATFTLADNSTFATVGGYATTFTFSGATSLTFPTSGTVTALGNSTTGSGAIVLASGPSITLENATGLPLATGITGFGTGIAAALGISVGSAGAPVLFNGALGTPSSGTLTNCTGYTVGNISGLGTGVGTWLATPTSANLAAAVTDETGSGPLVFATAPTFTSSVTLGTQSTTQGSLVLANTASGSKDVTLKSSNSTAASYTLTLPAAAPVNGYYLQTDTLGQLSWAAGGGGGGGSPGGSNGQVQYNNAGAFGGMPGFTFDGTAAVSLGVASTTSGSLKLYNSASANAVTVASGNNSAAWTMTLPTSAGTNTYFLQTDGSGNTTWAAAAAGTINTGTIGQITYYSGTNALSGTTTGTGVLTALGINVGTTGAFVAQDGALGTPSSGTLTNCSGLPISTGVSGLGTNVATALAVNVGTAGAVVVNGGALGTPSSGTLTNATGLPISTGVSGLGSNVATFLATPSSANLASAVTDETGSGSLVFGTSPTLATPRLAGSSTGYTSFASSNAGASNYTVTFPAENMTVGFRNIPAVGTKTSPYTLAVGDVGKYVQVGASGSITIPDATFAEGDVVSIFNNTSGAITITCTITTAYIAGTDADKASVSLATRGVATVLFISGAVCVISGNVS